MKLSNYKVSAKRPTADTPHIAVTVEAASAAEAIAEIKEYIPDGDSLQWLAAHCN